MKTLKEVMEKYPEGRKILYKNKYYATIMGYSLSTKEPEIIIRWDGVSSVRSCGQFSVRAKGFKLVDEKYDTI